MKKVTVLTLLTAFIGTSAFLIKVPLLPLVPSLPNNAPVGWVHLQKLILPLFENVCEDSIDPIIIRLAQEFTLDSSSGIYLKPEVVDNLQNLKSGKGLLPKGEIFTELNFDHINELEIIYEVFYYAKDFDTFYKAAAWARQNVNCGLFVDAVYLAIMNRRDTEKLSIPAPYELLPNYFINKHVVMKASSLLSGGEVTLSETVRDEGNAYIFDANYSASFNDNDAESKLAYFHEDIGLNSYYFLQKLKKAPWFNTPQDMDVSYGEYLYHMMKQLTARYALERYSNGLPEEKSINFDMITDTRYDPMLIYSNGNEISQRTMPLHLPENGDKDLLQNIESNIATIVNHMRGNGYNKTQILNRLMEILVTGDKSYETLARKLIGKDGSASQLSVLDHYMTSLRDPVFWMLNKKIVELVDDALKAIPSYTRNELYFPGVEVLNIDVKKMMTVFDYFLFDVTDALKTSTSTTNTAFQVKIGQPRLNHKPFAFKLNISSLVTQKGLVKIFLGPKVAPGELAIKKNLFMLLDSFEYNLKLGINIISRSSEEIMNLSEDFISLRTLYKNVEYAEFGLDALPLNDIESLIGFPKRLILPKGTADGLPLQIFVFVAPLVKANIGSLNYLTGMELNSAILSPGYPFDLDVTGTQLFELPNAMVKDFLITHKGDNKVLNYGADGATKKWQSSNYIFSHPDFSTKRKEPFDYSSKKGQYGKKEDYADKISSYSKPNQDHTDDINDSNQITDDKEVISVKNTKLVPNYSINEVVKDDRLEKKEDLNQNKLKDQHIDTKELPSDINEDDIQRRQFLKLSPTMKHPNIFDYIIPFQYYDYDEKVYE